MIRLFDIGTATFATAQGPRSHQEDRCAVMWSSDAKGDYAVLAVADGHAGGPEVAEFATAQLPAIFKAHRHLQTGEQISQSLYELGRLTKDMRQGSTISAVHIENGIAHVAFMGDSPIVIINDAGSLMLNDIHNVYSNRREREMAEERGGSTRGDLYYLYAPGGPGLQLTRSLGDSRMGKVIKREPEYYSVKLGSKSLIIICSDGILDLAHEHDRSTADKLACSVKEGATADDILAWAEAYGLKDNATALVYNHH